MFLEGWQWLFFINSVIEILAGVMYIISPVQWARHEKMKTIESEMLSTIQKYALGMITIGLISAFYIVHPLSSSAVLAARALIFYHSGIALQDAMVPCKDKFRHYCIVVVHGILGAAFGAYLLLQLE